MISKKCKYAIKAILYIADKRKEKRAVMSTEIAANQKIPHKFLEGILRDLRNNGILNSKRGKDGGYTLLKKPEEINMTELMRIMDGPIALLPCVSLNYYTACSECDESTCRIKNVFIEVRDKMLEVLNNTTVANLSKE